MKFMFWSVQPMADILWRSQWIDAQVRLWRSRAVFYRSLLWPLGDLVLVGVIERRAAHAFKHVGQRAYSTT
jgi:hypothetical protein